MSDQEIDKSQLTGRARSLANLRPAWQPGYAPNPRGRQSGHLSITAALRRVLASKLPNDEKRREVDLLAEALIQVARRGNGTAIREILARIDGPIPQVGENGEQSPPPTIVEVRVVDGRTD